MANRVAGEISYSFVRGQNLIRARDVNLPSPASVPATVQNSYAANAAKASSVTDQRNRFVFSWIYEPHALNGGQGWLGKVTKGWKNSGVISAGSGRRWTQPWKAMQTRTETMATTVYRGQVVTHSSDPIIQVLICVLRRLYSKHGWKLEFTAESFNLFNRLNSRFQLTSDGAISNAEQFHYVN